LEVSAPALKDIPRTTPVSFEFFTPAVSVRPHPNPSPIEGEGLFDAAYGQTYA
jgi:hypothetical protein